MFAARKEFELLKLLATDKKALATARRLGAFRCQPQPPSPAVAAGDGKAAAAPPPVAAAPAASAPAQNSRQRRGALRSAKYHATRRAQFWSRSVLATMFIVKLRRIVGGTLGLPGGPADAGAPSGPAKRGPDERPSSGCSNSSSGSSTRSSGSEMAFETPGDFFAYAALNHRGRQKQQKQQRRGLLPGFLLTARPHPEQPWQVANNLGDALLEQQRHA